MEKIPTERTIYDYTIKQMKALKVHDVAYNRIVGIYAGMLRQYYILVKDWEGNGCPATVESAAGSLKKHPSLDQIEKLRKDILAYSNQLMLNPKSNNAGQIKEDDEPNPFANFIK